MKAEGSDTGVVVTCDICDRVTQDNYSIMHGMIICGICQLKYYKSKKDK